MTPETVAAGPFAAQLRAAGARFTQSGDRMLAADFGSVSGEVAVCRRAVGIADASPFGKLEIHAPPAILTRFAGRGDVPLETGEVTHTSEGWWCRTEADRMLTIVPPALTPRVWGRLEQTSHRWPASTVADVSGSLAGLALIGPKAHTLSEHLVAQDGDLDPDPAFVRSELVSGVPTIVVRDATDHYMLLFSVDAAAAIWTTVLHAGEPLGAACVGTSALGLLDAAAGTLRHALAD